MKKSSTTVMTEGVIWKQLLFFAIPLLASNLFQQLYNSVDAVIVGKFCGSTALAAVGTTGALISLVVNLLFGIANGCSVVISQKFGAHDSEGLSDALHTAFAIAVIGGLLLTGVGILLSRPLLVLMQSPADVIDLADQYLKIYFLGSIFMLIYNTGAASLRAIGDSRHPFYYLLFGSITNIVLDLLFIVSFKMGVEGTAWATVISQGVSAVLVVIQLLRTQDVYRLVPSKIRIHMYLLPKILRIGIPNGLMGMMYAVPNMAVQSQINRFGSIVMAGSTSCGKLESFVYMLIAAFGMAITTFNGQNYGAGHMDRVKRGTRVCICMSLIVSAALITTFLLFHKPLLRIFADDPEVIYYGTISMFAMLPGYMLYVFVEVLSGALRGCGSTLIPMIITAVCICLVRVIYLALMMPLFPNLVTVYMCYPLSWSVASAALGIYYFKGKWRPAEN